MNTSSVIQEFISVVSLTKSKESTSSNDVIAASTKLSSSIRTIIEFNGCISYNDLRSLSHAVASLCDRKHPFDTVVAGVFAAHSLIDLVYFMSLEVDSTAKASNEGNGDMLREISMNCVKSCTEGIYTAMRNIDSAIRERSTITNLNDTTRSSTFSVIALPVLILAIRGLTFLPVAFRKALPDIIVFSSRILRDPSLSETIFSLSSRVCALAVVLTLRSSRVMRGSTQGTTYDGLSQAVDVQLAVPPLDLDSTLRYLLTYTSRLLEQSVNNAAFITSTQPSDLEFSVGLLSVLPQDGMNHTKPSPALLEVIEEKDETQSGALSSLQSTLTLSSRLKGVSSLINSLIDFNQQNEGLQVPSFNVQIPLSALFHLIESMSDVQGMLQSGLTSSSGAAAALAAVKSDPEYVVVFSKLTEVCLFGSLQLLSTLLSVYPHATRRFRVATSRCLQRMHDYVKYGWADEGSSFPQDFLTILSKDSALKVSLELLKLFTRWDLSIQGESSRESFPELFSLVGSFFDIFSTQCQKITISGVSVRENTLNVLLHACTHAVSVMGGALEARFRFRYEQALLALSNNLPVLIPLTASSTSSSASPSPLQPRLSKQQKKGAVTSSLPVHPCDLSVASHSVVTASARGAVVARARWLPSGTTLPLVPVSLVETGGGLSGSSAPANSGSKGAAVFTVPDSVSNGGSVSGAAAVEGLSLVLLPATTRQAVLAALAAATSLPWSGGIRSPLHDLLVASLVAGKADLGTSSLPFAIQLRIPTEVTAESLLQHSLLLGTEEQQQQTLRSTDNKPSFSPHEESPSSEVPLPTKRPADGELSKSSAFSNYSSLAPVPSTAGGSKAPIADEMTLESTEKRISEQKKSVPELESKLDDSILKPAQKQPAVTLATSSATASLSEGAKDLNKYATMTDFPDF